MEGITIRNVGYGLVLAVAVIVAATAAAAGTIYVTSAGDFLNGDDAQESKLNGVPTGVDYMATIDVDSMMGEGSLRDLLGKGLADYSRNQSGFDIPEDYQSILKEFEERVGISLEALQSITVFGKHSENFEEILSNGYNAALLRTGWEEDGVVASLENWVDNLKEGTYKDITVYTIAHTRGLKGHVGRGLDAKIAVLSNGFYAIGSKDAVYDVVDTINGDLEALDGDLREQYDRLGQGQIKFSAFLPSRDFSNMELSEGFSLEGFASLEQISGSFSLQDSKISVKSRLGVSDRDSAKKVEDTLNGAIGLGKAMIGSQEVRDELDKIDMGRDGNVVEITYETSVEDFSLLIGSLQDISTPRFSSVPQIG